MTLTLETRPLPLGATTDGVVCVTGTRVPLDTLVRAYLRGATAEQIAEQYDAVPLEGVYAVIAYYLSHRSDVDAYLRERGRRAAAIREQYGSDADRALLRDRLLARRRRERTQAGE